VLAEDLHVSPEGHGELLEHRLEPVGGLRGERANRRRLPLQNMGEAMIKVIDAAGGNASLGLVGGKIIKMGEQQ